MAHDRVSAAIVVCLCCQLYGRGVRADDTTVAVRYRAPLDCPSEQEFLADARQRSPRVIAALPFDDPQLVVTITERSSHYAGRLERPSGLGAEGVREIGGPSCREVAVALALITAMTGDLIASGPSESLSKPAEDVEGATAGEAARNEPSPRDALEDQPSAPLAGTSSQVGGVSPLRWQIGADAGLLLSVVPSPLATASAFVQVGGRGSGTWVPAVRLSASWGASSWSSIDPTSSATAQFVWLAANVDGCPLQIGDPLALGLRPCARVTGGQMTASGSGRPSGTVEESRAWFAVGGLVRGHWQFARVAFLEFEAEAFVPLVRYQYYFARPDETVFAQGHLGGRLAAGGGFVFR